MLTTEKSGNMGKQSIFINYPLISNYVMKLIYSLPSLSAFISILALRIVPDTY